MNERSPSGRCRGLQVTVSEQRVLGQVCLDQCVWASVFPRPGRTPRPASRAPLGARKKSVRLTGKTQSLRELGQRRFFGLAHLRAAKPHEAAFRRGLGGIFGNVMQPSLEARGIARRLAVEQLRYLA